jgi:hypothetical protein
METHSRGRWIVLRLMVLSVALSISPTVADAAFSATSRVANTNRVALAAADTDVVYRTKQTPIIYAFEVDTQFGDRMRSGRSPAHNTTWSFRLNSGSWTTLTTSSSPAKLTAAGAAGMVDGTTVASGERIVGGSCGTFIAALKEHESSNPLEVGAEVRDGECSETQASIDLSAAASGDSFEFKLDQVHEAGTATLLGTAKVTIGHRRVIVVP